MNQCNAMKNEACNKTRTNFCLLDYITCDHIKLRASAQLGAREPSPRKVYRNPRQRNQVGVIARPSGSILSPFRHSHTLIQFVGFIHSFKCTTLNHEVGVKLRLAISSEVGLLLVHHKY